MSLSQPPDRLRDAFRRAVACQQQGDLAEADRLCAKILKAKPDHFDARHLQGLLRHQQGRNAEAIALLEEVLKIQPDAWPALTNLGLVLQAVGRHEEALASHERALQLKPDYVEALNNRGSVLTELRRHEEALASYDAALGIQPDYLEALYNRGIVLGVLGRHEAALASYRNVLAIWPDFAEAHFMCGVALDALHRPKEALASYERALALAPDHVEALTNRGIALDELGRHVEAVASFDAVLAIRPDCVEALNNRGTALIELARFEEALASYDRALAVKPDYAECRWNRSLLLLRLGRCEEGWRELEWRRTRDAWTARNFPGPEWTGEPTGQRLLVYAEHGLGDTIQFARFACTAAAKGAEVTLEVQPPMARLLRSLDGVSVVRKGDPLPAFDTHLPIMSLPRVLGTTLATIPADAPYLTADADRVAQWATRLPRDAFTVGIVWQGNPDPNIDRGRSIPLGAFAPLGRVAGVRLISLQKHDGTEQLARLPAGMTVTTLGDDFDAGPDAFVDSAAVIMNLDLVITSDTAMAHLAGALGRPVWIVLKKVPDWRYLTERDDTPWYPTARLFWQRRNGDWDEVFARVASELSRIVADRKTP